jgi:Ulp1 family protease
MDISCPDLSYSRTEVAPPADMSVRRSARLSGVEQQPFTPKPDQDEVILNFRSGIGSLNITNGDVSRLKPGEFLNDTLIEFGLKLWLNELHGSNPELASQVHVFSSFFYKKLSTKVPEDGYNSVRKWTSRFDLFQKKYIIVPINENMHWYLAIIYFPEYTLLPRPVQVTNVSPRRSTRRLGVVIDFPDGKDSERSPKQSLPPDPDPLPSAQADSVSHSGLLTPDSSRAEDQRDEIDVERMVESGPPLPGPSAKQIDGPCVEADDEDMAVDDPAGEDDSLTLLYPASSPHVQKAELPSPDHQDDTIEQETTPASRSVGEDSSVQTPEIPPTTSNEKSDHGRRNPTSPEISIVDDRAPSRIIEEEGPPESRNASEGSGIRTPGIPPTVFYGKSNHRRRNVTSPEVALVDNGAPVEIMVEEDVIMGNPDSEHEETAEHPKTYIFTFDSLSSKHPQAVKRLSKYLLMEARDKKQLAEETLTEPKGMQAFVPRQDNYCDCGIYLLHFAKTFMKDPKLSSEIIQNRSSPQRGRRALPHEHWDKASVGSYRTELTTCIHELSDKWKRERREQDAATKNQTEAAASAPQEQSSIDPTPAASAKADNDSDSEIEVLGSPTKKAPPSKAASRRDSGLAESRKKGTTARTRGG